MSDRTATPIAAGEPDEAFWRGLADGAFRLPRCAGCQRWVWPAQPRCPGCLRTELRWTDVAAEGVVYSWTRTWYPFAPERADALPYVVVLAELPAAGGSRVLGVLDGDDTTLRIGAPVVGRIAPPSARSLGLHSVVWELAR